MTIQPGEIWQSRDAFGTGTNGSGRESLLPASELHASHVDVDGSARAAKPACEGTLALQMLMSGLDRARGPSSITTTQTLVGPALAAKLLANNPNNRGIRREHVESLARDMVKGRWRKSHSAIAIGPTGCLGDGQHRLLAICKSGVSVVVDVAQYHDAIEFHDARTVWDTGWKRTKGSALELAGLVPRGQGRFIAPVIEAMAWVDGRLPRRPTTVDVLAIFAERRASIEAIYRLNPREFIPATRAAFVLAHMKCPSPIGACIELVTSKANLEPGSPALAIVRALPELQRRVASREQPRCVNAVLSLLYKHVKGRPGVERIRHSQEAIDFFLGKNVRVRRELS